MDLHNFKMAHTIFGRALFRPGLKKWLFSKLAFCPQQLFESPWVKFYRDLIIDHPPKEIILALNRLLKTIPTENKSLFRIPHALLRKLLTLLDLQYENLYALSSPLAKKKEPGNFLTFEKKGTNDKW